MFLYCAWLSPGVRQLWNSICSDGLKWGRGGSKLSSGPRFPLSPARRQPNFTLATFIFGNKVRIRILDEM